MTTNRDSLALSLQEALARELIIERSAARHHAPRRVRRHARTALVLRRLAERLDPAARPWAAEPRRAAHRHT